MEATPRKVIFTTAFVKFRELKTMFLSTPFNTFCTFYPLK